MPSGQDALRERLVPTYCACAELISPKLHRLFTFDAAPVSDFPKIHYFDRIRYASIDIFEEFESKIGSPLGHC